MASLYTHQGENIRKTFLLMSVFLLLVIGLGWVISQAYGSPAILYFAVALALFMNVLAYWKSDTIALALGKAVPVSRLQEPELYRIVENLAITAGLPLPRIHIIEAEQLNAFATGRDAKHSAVAVTRGALSRLTKVELEGVLAHELSHIGNRDILIGTAVVVLAGIVALVSDFFLRALIWTGGRRSNRDTGPILLVVGLLAAITAPIAASLIRLAVGRQREYLADASGAMLTRYPEGLASALAKIATDPFPLVGASSSTAHLYTDNPFKYNQEGKRSWLVNLFQTHPPIEERIARLRANG